MKERYRLVAEIYGTGDLAILTGPMPTVHHALVYAQLLNPAYGRRGDGILGWAVEDSRGMAVVLHTHGYGAILSSRPGDFALLN